MAPTYAPCASPWPHREPQWYTKGVIYLLTGENTYQITAHVRQLAKEIGLPARNIDGNELSQEGLTDVLRGTSLFGQQDLPVIFSLSEQPEAWEAIGALVALPNTNTAIIVEPKPDRRTKAYKQLVRHVSVIDCPLWTNKQHGLAKEWLVQQAKQQGVGLSPAQVQRMLDRATTPSERVGVFVINQAIMAVALQSLQLLDTVTDDAIDAVMPPATTDSVFMLLECAVARDNVATTRMLAQFRLTDEPHRLLALLASQWTQLMAVALVGQANDEVASQLSMHPYVAQKMLHLARQIGRQDQRELTKLIASLDTSCKQSAVSPWQAIDYFITRILLRN